ncbi:unnamed protein product [Meloidogyne enterolobii]|uniref:Uncharacterized protein n=1 Tax=Meloidogyne enterolobii TaxID=390850 RepID=A0ACB1B547_MELEN
MPKDIEMTTDVEQTGSLYLKMKRPLEVALADNPLAPRRSALSKNDTKALNLVPLPATKFESNARQEKKFSGGIWDEPSPEKEVKGNETFLKNPTSKTSKPPQNIAGDLYSDDEELETGLENKEEDEDSDYFGDEALEEGNRLLSSTAAKDVMKDETRKNPPPTSIGIRTSCHADKYILELQKRKNAYSSTLLDLDKENSKQQQQVSFDNFDLEKKRITENARARLLEFKKSEQQKLKNRLEQQKQPLLSGGFGAKKIRANQLNRNNLLSSDDETADIEEIGQNEDGEERGGEEDFEEEEGNNNEEDGPVIIMSRPEEEKEGVNKFGGGEKKISQEDDLINDYVADEQYYRETKPFGNNNNINGNIFNNNVGNPKKDATCEKQEMSEYMRLEMIAMTTILVRLNVAIKLDVLHSELTKYNANAFSSNSDLLEFIKKNCPTSVKWQDCGFNVSFERSFAIQK